MTEQGYIRREERVLGRSSGNMTLCMIRGGSIRWLWYNMRIGATRRMADVQHMVNGWGTLRIRRRRERAVPELRRVHVAWNSVEAGKGGVCGEGERGERMVGASRRFGIVLTPCATPGSTITRDTGRSAHLKWVCWRNVHACTLHIARAAIAGGPSFAPRYASSR
jgi:hypothetical protein